MSKYEELVARGMIAQTTNEAQVKELIDNGKAIFYVGFDPTADSLHVGHLLVMIAMKHLQEAGNKAIALIGGGTVMIGDPTGKTDMRRMMGRPEIEANCAVFRQQLSKFIDFSDDKAIMVDNGDWLLNLNYIEFLREVGVHFTVNRMLTFECYKSRLERGLSFIEFNYMLMQSYDFYKLYKNYGCNLQVGGDDQWANILGGTELVRRIDGDDVNGLTMKLLTTSEGKKMGKTEKGALWLDPEKCSPYEFYQYWRNVSDADVIRLMKIFTFLPLEEIAKYENLEGAQLNVAKEVLAYEITKLVHSEEDAKKAQDAARAMFGGGNAQEVPTLEVAKTDASAKSLLDILAENKLVPSKSEGRRLIQQKGIHFDDTPVEEIDFVMGDDCDGKVVRIGKKKRYRITLV
ncbi:MAG: tyrosine--tRNA ligase [Clostridia bacterium]|nr:tyrosine--tRNA ligase [Clostridia bacterium]